MIVQIRKAFPDVVHVSLSLKLDEGSAEELGAALGRVLTAACAERVDACALPFEVPGWVRKPRRAPYFDNLVPEDADDTPL